MSSTFFTGYQQSTSPWFWIEGAHELCELIYEPSYALTDEFGGIPYATFLRWLVQMLHDEGAILEFKDPVSYGYNVSSSRARMRVDHGLLHQSDHVQNPGSDPRKLA
ncbi:hypothetical protein N7494_002877 [Penicillium frequentans]|uniref:Uncharacterized protein n=1 Tax=Penicillium frequentans TaxID=3151616 RepID=A0AAD6D4Q5_9EURO|nr:hypothetical protein N7494_002877 [Penicillium glabrum]